MMLCAGRKTLAKFEFVKFVELATQLMKNLACLGRDFMLFEVFNESFAGMCFHVNTRTRVSSQYLSIRQSGSEVLCVLLASDLSIFPGFFHEWYLVIMLYVCIQVRLS